MMRILRWGTGALLWACTANALLVCDQPAFNFGQADESDVIEHVFTLRQTGTFPVRITRVLSNCGCTVSEFTRQALAPGETTGLSTRIALRDRTGPQRFSLHVQTDNQEQPALLLHVTGTVSRQVDISPPRLEFNGLAAETVLSGQATVSTAGDIMFSITGIGASDPALQATLETLHPAQTHRIRVDIDTRRLTIPFQGSIYLQTDHPGYSLLYIPVSVNTRAGDTVPIIFFYQPGCPECETVRREILPTLESVFPGRYHLTSLDVNIPAHTTHLLAVQETLGVWDNAPVSILVDDRFYLAGAARIRDLLIPTVQAALAERAKGATRRPIGLLHTDPSTVVSRRVASFTVAGVMIAGLIDSLNPCAISVLVFLVSALSLARVRGRRLAAAGTAYIAASFITYFLLGFGVLSIVRTLGAFDILKHIMDTVMVVILLVLAGLSVRDAWMYHDGGDSNDIRLQLPVRIKARVRRFTRQRLKTRRLVTAALMIGSGVTVLESVCTGQVYGPALVMMARTGRSLPRVLGLLGIYNLMFVMPLVIVFALAAKGMQTPALMAWSRHHVVPAKLMMAALFTGMALVILCARLI